MPRRSSVRNMAKGNVLFHQPCPSNSARLGDFYLLELLFWFRCGTNKVDGSVSFGFKHDNYFLKINISPYRLHSNSKRYQRIDVKITEDVETIIN